MGQVNQIPLIMVSFHLNHSFHGWKFGLIAFLFCRIGNNLHSHIVQLSFNIL